jgi:hypothetical protein
VERQRETETYDKIEQQFLPFRLTTIVYNLQFFAEWRFLPEYLAEINENEKTTREDQL